MEENAHISVEDVVSDGVSSPLSFSPDLADSQLVSDLLAEPTARPLEGAIISLPGKLLSQLSSTHEAETLRVVNTVQNALLFVTEEDSRKDDSHREQQEDEVVGNLVVSAAVFTSAGGRGRESLLVGDLPDNQAVIVQFNVTQVINAHINEHK